MCRDLERVCGLVIAASLLLSAPIAAGQDGAPTAAPSAEALAALRAEGEAIYQRDCASCHGADGAGDGAGPALANVPALARADHVIRRILRGAADAGMPPFATLSDREAAAVATFVRTSWGNAFGAAVEAEVRRVRETK